jgi:hypothetical protein
MGLLKKIFKGKNKEGNTHTNNTTATTMGCSQSKAAVPPKSPHSSVNSAVAGTFVFWCAYEIAITVGITMVSDINCQKGSALLFRIFAFFCCSACSVTYVPIVYVLCLEYVFIE